MRHALALGVARAIGTIPLNLGPAWLPIAIVLSAWLGGALHRSAQGAPR
jgi:hypothetical protein